MRLRWRWPPLPGKRPDLDGRVAAARAAEEHADAEHATSTARYDTIRKQVIDPLHREAVTNHFAERIRREIREGYQ